MQQEKDALELLHEKLLADVGGAVELHYKKGKSLVRWWWPTWYRRLKFNRVYDAHMLVGVVDLIAQLQGRVKELENKVYHTAPNS